MVTFVVEFDGHSISVLVSITGKSDYEAVSMSQFGNLYAFHFLFSCPFCSFDLVEQGCCFL